MGRRRSKSKKANAKVISIQSKPFRNQAPRPKLSPEQQEKLNKQLLQSAEIGDTQKIKELLEKGANVNTKSNVDYTPLMKASYSGQTKAAELLIQNSADLESRDRYERTALMFACWHGHYGTAKLLLESGADVRAKNYMGLTPMKYAEQHRHTGIVKLCKEYLVKNSYKKSK